MAEAMTPDPPEWLATEERGSSWGIEVVLFLCKHLGRRAGRAFMVLLTGYYMVFHPKARRASQDWLGFVTGRTAGLLQAWKHLLVFAWVTLDRIFLLTEGRTAFSVTRDGNELLEELTAQRKGALLIGAHMGSFEAMRVVSDAEQHDLYILAYTDNAQKINALLTRLDPAMAGRVITIDGMQSTLRAKELIEGGAMVAVLADRVGLNDKEVEVDFLGRRARLPAGPYLLAHILQCPVYVTFGLYEGANRYALSCQLLSDRIRLPRGADREQAVTGWAQKYADMLAAKAQAAPYNWFNFYDFFVEDPR